MEMNSFICSITENTYMNNVVSCRGYSKLHCLSTGRRRVYAIHTCRYKLPDKSMYTNPQLNELSFTAT